MDQAWLSALTSKAMRICRLNKQAAGNHRQDMTGPVLDRLLGEGYTQVRWNSNGSHHSECVDLNRQVWDLQNFLATTEYDAPLFSRSHPGDASCTLTVSGPGLPDVEVDSYGETNEGIGTGRLTPSVKPAPAPVLPEMPTTVVKPTAPKEKVVEPVVQQPEKKVVPVTKEVHKQLKDPFEKEKLTPEEYEEWLKSLEQETVEESIPQQPKYTDEEIEEWQRGLDRETKLKIPQWIKGILKD